MRISQDTALGGLLSAVGVTAFIIALDYPTGSAGRMGPGYFPLVIASLLTITGAAVLLRGRLGSAEVLHVTRWWPVVAVIASIVAFGLLIERLGLPLAVMVLAIGAATASVRFRLGWKPVAGAALFAALCGVLFVQLLGLPIPIVGTWLQALSPV